MKKFIYLFAVAASLSAAAMAATPTGTVTGKVMDADSYSAVQGAIIELASSKGKGPKYYGNSDASGSYAVSEVPYGDYKARIFLMGYKEATVNVSVKSATQSAGTVNLSMDSKTLAEVVAVGQAIRTSQKGDTVTYNAEAFKVAKDADAEGLLTKMPGIRIVDGAVEAQGETVRKVLVDGKEFFGDDVNSAIKNLPAEAIAKIEVYNKQSDQAELTGVDDGQSYKAINIVTRSDMRQGQFGKVYAGYGFDDKYIAGGNVNIFSGTNRFSIIGLSNNMNQQNFSSEDILGAMGSGGGSGGMRTRTSGGGGGGSYGRGGSSSGFMVPQQAGISTTNAIGINYSGQLGSKVTLQGSYFFNNSDNDNVNDTGNEYYSQTDTRRLNNSWTKSGTSNLNHRFNARVEYKINDRHSIMYRPSISYQNNENRSRFDQTEGSGTYVEGRQTMMSDTSNVRRGESSYDNSGYNIYQSLLYRAKLNDKGRALTLDGYLSMSTNDRTAYDSSKTVYYPLPSVEQRDVYTWTVNSADRYSLRATASYYEPLSARVILNVQYRAGYNDQPANRKVYDYLFGQGRFNDQIDPLQSNIYTSNYLTQSAGPGINYSSPKTVLSANVSYQYSSLEGDQKYPVAGTMSHSFNNVVYFGMLRQTFSPNNTLQMFMRSSTDNPSVSDLQNAINLTNLQYVTQGNDKLKPSYEHNLYLNYNRSMVGAGRTLMVMLGGSVRSNYIADSLILRHPVYGGRYSRPVNMDGYRSMRSMVSYGTPVKWLRSNININAGVDYSRLPSYINSMENVASSLNYNGGVVLSSNISANLDFTLRYNVGYNTVNNTINESNDNYFFNQTAYGRFKWVFWKGFTLASDASYTKYSDKSGTSNLEYLIVNATVGKKVFRNQRGEINFGIYDALDQNRSYRRSFSGTSIITTSNSVISRYFGINFIYNLRNFGKRSSSRPQAESPESFVRPEGGRPMIMMPGGGPGGPGGPF